MLTVQAITAERRLGFKRLLDEETMLNKRMFTRWSAVLFTSLLVLGTVSCGARALAEPATPEPTAGIQPNVKPGNATATPNLTPLATLVPGDPNAPISNTTPIPSIPLPNRTVLHGRITDAAGNPIARARISIPKASQPVPEIAYLSNADGKYTLSVPHGEYTLAVNADGFAQQTQNVTTQQEADIELNWVLK